MTPKKLSKSFDSLFFIWIMPDQFYIVHLLHENPVVFLLELVVSGSGLHHIPDHLHHLGLVLFVLLLKALTLLRDLQQVLLYLKKEKCVT